jgi:hypothetical protein
VNVTIASNAMEPVIRDSTEALDRNLGKITIPPTSIKIIMALDEFLFDSKMATSFVTLL